MFPTTESRLLKKLFRAPPLPLEPFSLSPDLLVSALSLLFPRTHVAIGWGAGDWSPSGRITAMVLFHALHRGEREPEPEQARGGTGHVHRPWMPQMTLTSGNLSNFSKETFPQANESHKIRGYPF